MRAAIRSKYGPPDILTIADVDRPTPAGDEISIKVHAATANRSDYHVLTGRPFVMRLFTGLLRPRRRSTGTDFAGKVEAVGPRVRTFKVGDRVVGFGGPFGAGSHAEYVCFPESGGIVAMPKGFDYLQAAACIEGPAYASGIFMRGKVKAGENALVNGATGAIGSAYLQLFRHFGVHVTAVCRQEHFDLVRSLGAERCIDYNTEDFTLDDEQYDYVLDTVGNSSFTRCKRLLKSTGIYAGNTARDLLWAILTFRSKGKRVLLAPPPSINAVLQFVSRIIADGGLQPVIDRTYRLEDIAEAFRYVAAGDKVGAVVIEMDA